MAVFFDFIHLMAAAPIHAPVGNVSISTWSGCPTTHGKAIAPSSAWTTHQFRGAALSQVQFSSLL